MATVRDQGKLAASAKYDAFVEAQLDKARRRIRLLDVSSALLLFAAGALVYVLVVGLLDRRLELSALARQVAFTGYAVASVLFLAVAIVLPLCRRINPYFAAREMERVMPGAKNSLVNWLDLHGETLPPAIRGALSQRAAKDLAKADLEQAISGRRAVWLTGLTALLLFGLFGLFVTSGAGGFGTLLARTFAPFGGGADARRTYLEIVRPVNGDAVLGVGQPFNVAVRVGGWVPDSEKPDALKLLFRYRDGEPYEEQLLEPEAGDVWKAVVPASRTQNGFWYKVVGGDAETPEFRVTVRASPLVTGFEVTYHHRPYTGWTDDHKRDANLKDLRGTEVELVVRTNRPVKEGRLEVETREGKRSIHAELIADDPQAMRARQVLDQDGQYRVWFTATDNDSNVAATTYTITVIPDHPPFNVELRKPGADVTLPANGTLRLEGSAADDIGVKELTLRLRPADGPALAPKPYRAGTSFQLADGGYPKTLDYRDFVALDQLKDEHGKPFPLAKGMVLEYWLEAADACDFPAPHRTESKRYKVTIAEPAPDKQQQEKERGQAAEEQRKHEKQQDEKLKKEEQQRQEEKQRKEDEQRKESGKPDEGKGGKPDQPKDPGGEKLDQTAEAAAKALDQKRKEEQSQQEKGGSKGPKEGKGEGKGDPQADQQPQEKGDAKPEGQKGEGKEGAGKNEGAKQEGKQPDTGGGKNEGAQHQDAAAGDRKDGGKGEHQGAAAPKADGPPKPDKCECKGGGKGESSQSAGAPKEHGSGQPGEKGEASAKGAGRQTDGDPGAKGAPKGDQPSTAKGAPKPGEAGGEPKGEPKREGNPQGDGAKAEGKSGGPEKADGSAVAKGGPKDDPNKRSLSSELQRHEREARQGDDRQSAEAEQWLKNLAQNAKDKEVRDLAQKILDDARKDRESSPALPKAPPRDDIKDGPTCQCKGGGGAQSGSVKPGEGKGSGEGKQEGKPQTAQAAGKPGGEGREGGGRGLIANGQQALLQGLQADEARPATADPSHRSRAGSLQIEDFRNIDKDILKELGMTPEEWEAFKKAWYERRQREAVEQLPGSQGGGPGSVGARKVEAEKGDKAGDKTGLGQVPPEFRGAYRDYIKRQSEKK